ncbi:MAG: serine hydrolase domain-containing protein [Gemmatimonadota bacterium]|nr:serine hydrolase domain-containing protein [Gemmatimonadota bacterium]
MPGISLRAAALGLLLGTMPGSAVAQSYSAFPPAVSPDSAGFSLERLQRIDSLVIGLVANSLIPGAVVFISRRGQLVFHKAYGVRDMESQVPMHRDDIFRIASQSKAITALAVMMLWEEGRFQLDDPVSRYIPEFTRPTVLKTFKASDTTWTTEPAGREMTIRQLLTHTSGLDYASIGSRNFQAIYAKAGVPSGIGNDTQTIGEKMRLLGGLPLRQKPGEEFVYSLSSDVLGYLVEVLSGMPFDQYLRTRIFDPLGMRDTWFYLPPDRHARLVTIHDGASGKAVPLHAKVFDGVDPNYPKLQGTYFSGGAGLSSTVENYARFLQLFLNKGEFNGVRLLSPKTVEMMLVDQLPTMDTEFGLGFGLETAANDYQSPKSIGSFSWGGAFATTYWADPQEGLVAQIYTNMINPPARSLGAIFTVLTYSAMVPTGSGSAPRAAQQGGARRP